MVKSGDTDKCIMYKTGRKGKMSVNICKMVDPPQNQSI